MSSQFCGYHCAVSEEDKQEQHTYITFKIATELFEPLTAVVLVVWVILKLFRVQFYFTFYTITLLWY